MKSPDRRDASRREDSKVYFADLDPEWIENENFPVTKVGVSVEPRVRIENLMCSLPFNLDLVAVIDSPDPYSIEFDLHERFREEGWGIERGGTEWFQLPDRVVEWAEGRDVVSSIPEEF